MSGGVKGREFRGIERDVVTALIGAGLVDRLVRILKDPKTRDSQVVAIARIFAQSLANELKDEKKGREEEMSRKTVVQLRQELFEAVSSATDVASRMEAAKGMRKIRERPATGDAKT